MGIEKERGVRREKAGDEMVKVFEFSFMAAGMM